MGDWPRHPDSEIHKQLRRIEKAGGWTVEHPFGHWGRIRCDGDDTGHCSQTVPGTPRSAGNVVKRLRRYVSKCHHGHRIAT
jgi:hypothetical protein